MRVATRTYIATYQGNSHVSDIWEESAEAGISMGPAFLQGEHAPADFSHYMLSLQPVEALI